MNIKIINDFNKNIEKEDVEMVERKGIGHPDSLADLIAETFSNKYSRYCIKNFGVILNHWADKVLISGAKSEINFGNARILKPVNIYLFGKATNRFGKHTINISNIFKESVEEVFTSVFKNSNMLKHIRYIVDINDGIGMDHSKEFYNPTSINNFKGIKDLQVANDSVICSGYAGLDKTEFLAIDLECFINSTYFKNKFPETGYDVKILVVKTKENFNVTICVPFIAEMTKSLSFYKERLALVKKVVLIKAKKIIKDNGIVLNINTKDKDNGGYITAFGTALDKGDYGAVGRGNRYNGIININRETNIEAVSGKNPVHHTGKLYTIISQDIANEIYRKFRVENYVNIATQNGLPLTNPLYVVVKLCENSINKDEIEDIVNKKIKNIKKYTNRIIQLNPAHEFRILKSIRML
jgi:S-adenosylmethionine synthetase